MSNEQKMISIAPIPLSKLTVVINNFLANTITHLNKLKKNKIWALLNLQVQ